MFAGKISAQSYELLNTRQNISNFSTFTDKLFIGDSADITVSGEWYIFSTGVYISPSAKISGTGTIRILNPNYAGLANTSTTIDGGNTTQAVDVTLNIETPYGVVLGTLNPSTYSLSDYTDNSSHHLYISKNLAFQSIDVFSYSNSFQSLVLNNNNLVFSSAAAATPANYGTQRYIVTNGSGVMKKESLGANTSFTFPVGRSIANNHDYTPASVTNGSTAQDINMAVQSYTNSPTPETNSAYGMDRTWMLFTSAGASLSSLELTHNSATNGAQFPASSPTNGSYIARFNGNTGSGLWTHHTTLTSENTSSGQWVQTAESSILGNTATSNNSSAWYSKTSDFNNSLPVRLINFNTVGAGCELVLHWSTGAEFGNYYFDIEHSLDGKEWHAIGKMESIGSSSNKRDYTFNHKAPLMGLNYYRLIQHDMDGSKHVFPIISAINNCDGNGGISLWPNPTADAATLQLSEGYENAKIYLYNIIGERIIADMPSSGLRRNIQMQGLSAGTYILQVVQGTETKYIKIVFTANSY
jgi:hypothetical protein